ncbi:putative phage abortive infection protein [Paenibacillus jiagnxiensis]|uniref:putative phage abortive infection protein n=1 Tax=Paenibacillus jiagnxiensis TaxID=3228926 RepID=UPI0033A3ABEC
MYKPTEKHRILTLNKLWSYKLFAVLILIIVVAFGLYGWLVPIYFKDWGTSGTFGDTFGGLNSLFSGIALAGLVTTMTFQRKQMNEQEDFNKLQFLQSRYEYLLGQFKAWKTSGFNYTGFFDEVEKALVDSDDEKIDEIFYKYGAEYKHFIFMFKTTLDFIANEYVPNNIYITRKDIETSMLIEILKSKIGQYDLALLGIHSIKMNDQELHGLINKFDLLRDIEEAYFGDYPFMYGAIYGEYITWEDNEKHTHYKE